MENQVAVSVPPHIRGRRSSRGIMLDVAISLLPCAVMACVYFQLYALTLLLVCVAGAVATEFVYYFIAKGGFAHKCSRAGEVVRSWARQFDCTSVVTGLILALILPAYTKWYEALLGSVFAIALVKMLFGGTGKNLVNPAAAGRVFLFISFSLSAGALLTDGTLTTGATYLSGTLLSGGSLSSGATYGDTIELSLLQLFLGNGVATAAIRYKAAKTQCVIGNPTQTIQRSYDRSLKKMTICDMILTLGGSFHGRVIQQAHNSKKYRSYEPGRSCVRARPFIGIGSGRGPVFTDE